MEPKLINKYLANTATDTEMERMLDWLDEDPANRREFDEIDRAVAIAMIHGSGEADGGRVGKPRRSVWRRAVLYTVQAAAVAAIGLGLSYVLLEKRVGEWTAQTVTLDVSNGNYLNLKLQDGTTVWLNGGTVLEYPLVFAEGKRRVRVSGEAIFDVVHDPARPFIVETFACDVEVLGTKFGVIAEEAAGLFSTAVFDGSVKITNRLMPGEQFVFGANDEVWLVEQRLAARTLDNLDAFLWTEGVISITGLSFEELMHRFEKSFGVTIMIDRSFMPAVNYNHGKIRISDGVDSALRLLQMASDFKYTRDQETGTIIIK